MTSRIVVEQAKGVIADRGDLGMEDAFTVLRRYAGDRRLRLSDVFAAVVSGELAGAKLFEHARKASSVP